MKSAYLLAVVTVFACFASAAPILVSPTPNNEVLNQSWAFINVTLSETPVKVYLEWNGVNETLSQNTSNTLFFINKTSLAGNCTFKAYALDASNNSNVSETRWAYLNMPPKIMENASLDVGGFVGETFEWSYGLSSIFGFNRTDWYIEAWNNSGYTIEEDDPRATCSGLVCSFTFPQKGDYYIDISIVNPFGKKTDQTIRARVVERREWSEPLKGVGGMEPRNSSGYIDADRLTQALKLIGANSVFLRSGYEEQWNDLLYFLPEAEQHDVMVFFFLPDARTYGAGPCGFCEHYRCSLPKPYCKDYAEWVEALANLSLEYPVLNGVFIDDFECGATSGENPGFSVGYIHHVMQAKNRINPNFKFLPGIYIPRGLSDFRFSQYLDNRCGHGDTANLTAQVSYAGSVDEAYFEIISSGKETTCFGQQVYINGEKKFESYFEGVQLEKIDLTEHDLSDLTIKYMFHMPGYYCYLNQFLLPRLFVNGQKVELEWSVEKDDCYIVEDYLGWIGQYYNLADGVIFWSNQFDLIEPENEIYGKLLDISKERVGENKLIVGHFYGAEPWREPVFPSGHYFDTFANTTMQKTDGVAPWYPILLSYYTNYSSGIYAQQENDDPDYGYRFHYPKRTNYVAGFYHGIQTPLTLPDSLSDANISFSIKDSYTGSSLYRRWSKELVVISEEFEQNFSCGDGEDCLWFEENGTLWWDFIAGNEGEQQVSIPFASLSEFFTPGEDITLVLRMRADEFRGAGSSPPEVSVWVTEPVVTINGEEIQTDWVFSSGNVMEQIWLVSSEKVRALYTGSGVECGNGVCEEGEDSTNCPSDCPPPSPPPDDPDDPPSNGNGVIVPLPPATNITTNQTNITQNISNCGNGIKEDGEECDKEDAVPEGYKCTDDCKLEEIYVPVCVDDGVCSLEEEQLGNCEDCTPTPECVDDLVCSAEEQLLGNCKDCDTSPVVLPDDFVPAFLWVRASAGTILILASLMLLAALAHVWMKRHKKKK